MRSSPSTWWNPFPELLRSLSIARSAPVIEPQLHHVSCLDGRGLHRVAYWEWGDTANPDVLLCLHGLTRQGRDFDVLARTMVDRYRVVCPDVVGRGRSDWLKDPKGY